MSERKETVEERVYIVPLFKKLRSTPAKKRTRRAVRVLREFVSRHMSSDAVAISDEVNKFLWRRSVERPPRHIRIKVTMDRDNIATVYLAEHE
ncbi:MAG: 50S ribosomal protein L31e [Candidatus Bathyarchaeia archaeon]